MSDTTTIDQPGPGQPPDDAETTQAIPAPDPDSDPDTAAAVAELAPGSIAIRAGNLADVLTALVECTSTVSEYPALTSIRLEAGNGRLVGIATDQHVLGHASKPAAGSADPVTLAAAGARRMLAELATVERYEIVTLHLAGDLIALQTAAAYIGSPPVVIAERLAGYPAKLADLLDVDGYDQIGLSGLVAFSPRLLATVAAATKTAGDHVCRLYFRAAEAPLRVEVGDWLVLLLMPYRTGGTYPMSQTPAITAGLPGTALEVELTDWEPTSVSWPRNEATATPTRMARFYAAHTQHLQRRAFDERFPNLPPYLEQDPHQRRMSAAMSDLMTGVVDSFATALMIRAFYAAAPAAAAAACRDLWTALDAGDSVGEEVWEWLKADKVDPDAIVADDVAAERFARAELIASQVWSTLPPVDPFRKRRPDEGADQDVTADVDGDPAPAAAAAFPTVEVTAAEIADDLGAIDRANARAREAEEGRTDQPAAGVIGDPWEGLPVAPEALGNPADDVDQDDGDRGAGVHADDDQPDDPDHPGWGGTVPGRAGRNGLPRRAAGRGRPAAGRHQPGQHRLLTDQPPGRPPARGRPARLPQEIRMTDNPLDPAPAGLAGEVLALPSGLPAVLLLGTAFALLGSYTGDAEILPGHEGGPDVVKLGFMVPACSCTDPERDVDPDCKRHYPDPPAELLALVARAVAESRRWAQAGSRIEGASAGDVNAASAVLDVLLRPGRNGVIQ